MCLSNGHGEIEPATHPAQVSLTRRQLAAWYAGAYRSTTSARLAGVRANSEQGLATLLQATSHTEPWLPDHF